MKTWLSIVGKSHFVAFEFSPRCADCLIVKLEHTDAPRGGLMSRETSEAFYLSCHEATMKGHQMATILESI